jgi:hypothetical protein
LQDELGACPKPGIHAVSIKHTRYSRAIVRSYSRAIVRSCLAGRASRSPGGHPARARSRGRPARGRAHGGEQALGLLCRDEQPHAALAAPQHDARALPTPTLLVRLDRSLRVQGAGWPRACGRAGSDGSGAGAGARLARAGVVYHADHAARRHRLRGDGYSRKGNVFIPGIVESAT